MAVPSETDGRVDVAVYSRRQMADLLDVSERHVDRMVQAGQIPGVFRSGRLVKFRRVVIDRWLAGESESPK
jgi:excisionase family DNA binding protein